MSVVLSEHLPLLATAPDGVQKLRGLILELAVRGKLVPQDPSDEPASELLKRIAKERARLEPQGKIKKSKPQPPVREDEQPFEVPQSWVWTRLGEVTNFGQTDKDGEIRDTTWVLDLEDIQKDTSVLLRKVRFAERQAKSDKNRFQNGDVLYGKLRPYLNKVIVADEKAVSTTEILPVRGYYGVFPRYLMHAVKRPDFLAYVNSKSYGMKMPRLGTDDGRLAFFPLPPEQEQHRIVAKIDELMALCDRLEVEQTDAEAAHERLVATLLGTLSQSTDVADLATNWQRLAEHFDALFSTESSLDALKQTILQLAVMGKLVPQDPNEESAQDRLAKGLSLPDKFVRRRKVVKASTNDRAELGTSAPSHWLISSIQSLYDRNAIVDYADGNHGSLYPRSSEFGDDGVLFVTAKDIGAGVVSWNKCARLNFDRAGQLTKGWAQGGDVLLTHNATVGRVARTETGAGRFLLGTSVTYYRLNAQILSPHFFYHLLCSPLWQMQLEEVMAQTTRNQVSIQKQALFHIVVPPLAEQQRIVAKVDELLFLVDRLKAGLAESRAQQERLATTLIETALKAA